MTPLDAQCKMIFDQISDSIVTFDHNGNIIYKNKVFDFLMTNLKSEIQRAEALNELRTHCLETEKANVNDRTRITLDLGNLGKFELNVYKIYNDKKNLSHHLVHIYPKDRRATTLRSPTNKTEPPSIEAPVLLDSHFKLLLGEDVRFKKALLMAQKAAPTDFPLLITGESGTGKELLARTIHQVSLRRTGPFVDINCAAIPENLVESELFGYERGTFTGAEKSGRPGLFEEAHSGTLFMDEVGDASLPTQSKVLRVLQEGLFKRVGGRKNISVDVRVISATNRVLSELIIEKKFREDLLYRLNTITIHLPSLRERRSDIPLFTEYFLQNHDSRKNQRMNFSTECMDILLAYEWPGNVRELKSVVEYALIMSDRQIITPDFLPNFLLPPRTGKSLEKTEMTLDLNAAIFALEKKMIIKALQSVSNKSEAIQKLGISRRTFYKKLKVYGLI
jgi:transcriptional regulator with PAS, ATPase and Fis domain